MRCGLFVYLLAVSLRKCETIACFRGFIVCCCTMETDQIEEDDVGFFREMPDEVVMKVLQNLSLADVSRVSAVSRRLRRLCLDASLWTRLSLPSQDVMGTARAIQLLQRCPRLDRLVLHGRPDVSCLAVHALAHCQHLASLSIAAAQVYSDAADLLGILAVAVAAAPGLHELSLTDVLLDGLSVHAHHLSNLTRLDLGGCKGLGGPGLITLGDHCYGLEYLRLRVLDCEGVDDAMNHFLQKARLTLQHLLLLGGRGLTDACFANLWWCNLLESLQISCADNLQLPGLQAILLLAQLRSLSITYAYRLTGMHFASAVYSCNGGQKGRLPELRGCSCCHACGSTTQGCGRWLTSAPTCPASH